MSYTKHNFASGDTLLASDLNAMEDQIADNEQKLSNFKALKGSANGLATLDTNSKLPLAQLPLTNDISNATKEWLEENISPETEVVIDKSLSIEGAAADAKTVGNLKSAIGNNVFTLDDYILKPIKYATLSSDMTVTFNSSESQLYTDYVSRLIPLPETLDGKITHNGNGYSSFRAIVFYDNTKTPIGSSTQNGYNLIETTIPDDASFFRLRRAGGNASQVLQVSFNLSAEEKVNYLQTLLHVEPDLYIHDFDAQSIFTLEHTEISDTTGEESYSSSSNYSATDFIPLPDDIELIGTYAYTASGRARVAFYNSNKNFISAVYSATKRLTATAIPEGAVYVRFGTHSTIPPASCIAVGLMKATTSNDEIIDIIRSALV